MEEDDARARLVHFFRDGGEGRALAVGMRRGDGGDDVHGAGRAHFDLGADGDPAPLFEGFQRRAGDGGLAFQVGQREGDAGDEELPGLGDAGGAAGERGELVVGGPRRRQAGGGEAALEVGGRVADGRRDGRRDGVLEGGGVVVGHPAGQAEHLFVEERDRRGDACDRAQRSPEVGGVWQGRDEAVDGASAEGDEDPGAHADGVPQLFRDEVVEFPVQGEAGDDAGDAGHVTCLW